MTPADLRVLLERATPGPWKAESGYLEGPAKSGLIGGDVMEDETGTLNGFFWKDENAQAIVALRTLAPHLLDLWSAAERLISVIGPSMMTQSPQRAGLRKAVHALQEAEMP